LRDPERRLTGPTPDTDALARTHSQLWIGHDIDWYRDAVKAPGWYD